MSRFTDDFITILVFADVTKYKNYRFIIPNFKGDTPIEALDLSMRAQNSLKRKGISTFEQLRTAELKKIWGCGIGTIKEIRTKFLSYIYDRLSEEERKDFWKRTFEATKQMYNEKPAIIKLG